MNPCHLKNYNMGKSFSSYLGHTKTFIGKTMARRGAFLNLISLIFNVILKVFYPKNHDPKLCKCDPPPPSKNKMEGETCEQAFFAQVEHEKSVQ